VRRPSLTVARRGQGLAVDTLRLAAGFTGLVAIGAAVLHLAEQGLAGNQLPDVVSPAGAADELGEAGRVLLGNGRVLALVLGAALLARHAPAPAARAITAVLVAIAALNAFALATALAASPTRTLSALALHGPLELLAFSLAAALYRRHHTRNETRVSHSAAGALSSCAVLALAAVLEVRSQ